MADITLTHLSEMSVTYHLFLIELQPNRLHTSRPLPSRSSVAMHSNNLRSHPPEARAVRAFSRSDVVMRGG